MMMTFFFRGRARSNNVVKREEVSRLAAPPPAREAEAGCSSRLPRPKVQDGCSSQRPLLKAKDGSSRLPCTHPKTADPAVSHVRTQRRLIQPPRPRKITEGQHMVGVALARRRQLVQLRGSRQTTRGATPPASTTGAVRSSWL